MNSELAIAISAAEPATVPAGGAQAGRGSVLSRLLVVTVVAVCVVHLAGALVIAGIAAKTAERQFEEHVTTILESRAKLMAMPLWKMQYENLSSILAELADDPAIVSATVIDDTGAVVARTGQPDAARWGRVRAAPIVYRDGNIKSAAGRFEMTVSRASITRAYWLALKQTLFIALLATAAIALGLWFATQRYIGRPLDLISAAIDRSRLDGKRYRVEWESDDEFGALAQAFNAMQHAAEPSEHALRTANQRLDFLAMHDELTGLPNRRSFEDRLTIAANAMGEQPALAVHFIDLDDFKAINDTLGHAAGDALLRHVATSLRAVVHEDNFAARFGGDEFVVLQTGVASEADARHFAERLLGAIGRPLALQGNTLQANASIGVAMLDDAQSNVAKLLSFADIALYEAKRNSRGTISFLTSAGHDAHSRRRELERDIRAMTGWKEFVLYFQPQVDMQTGHPVGLEALVRWDHPSLGLLGPMEFLPLIEGLGLSCELGAHVVREACRAARHLRELGLGELRVAINLAPAQLIDRHLTQLFVQQIATMQLPAGSLEVEMTEGALIRDPVNTRKVLSGLRRLGVSVALDDFGTGYSSLAYLRRFPIDRIKLDRSFVRELPETRETAAIVRAIRDLATALGVELIAEGTEREVEAEFLLSENIRIAQGYLYCKPRSLDDICAWLAERPRSASEAA
jgi:diguanylate cyclase (GGDEF)-like protein